MMKLYEIRDWLKTLNCGFEHFYIGKLDSKQDKSLGVYRLPQIGSPINALGGRNNSSYDIKQASLLVHWTNNGKDTENASDKLFEAIMGASDVRIGEYRVLFINMLTTEPQDVGVDEKGIYESVIEIEIYYERKK